jgi:hypothetical protein
MDRFDAAPWSKLLWVATIFSSALLVGVGYAAWRVIPHGTRKPGAELVGTIVAWVPPLIALFAILFVVRGFALEGRTLVVRRLLWFTVLPLDDVRSVEADPQLLRGSLRVVGNGGLFSITGTFWNRRIGRYRAFITDPGKTVVLVTGAGTIALSPDDPVMFVDRIRAMYPAARIERPADMRR